MGTARGIRAFSMIELVVVLAIVAILAGVGVVRAGTGAAEYRARLAAKRVATDLEQARQQSMYRSTTVSVEFDAANDSYTITGLLEDGGTTIVDLSKRPFRLDLSAVSIDGGVSVAYAGGVASTAAPVELTMVSGDRAFDASVRTDVTSADDDGALVVDAGRTPSVSETPAAQLKSE